MHEPVGMGGIVAALSVTSDLTRGHPQGEAMRATLLATELREANARPGRRAGGCAADASRRTTQVYRPDAAPVKPPGRQHADA